MKTYRIEYGVQFDIWLVDVETDAHILLEDGMELDITRIQPPAPSAGATP